MTAIAAQPSKKLINARRLGRLLGKNRETILSWARDGLIPHHKFSARTILFNEHEVKAEVLKWKKQPAKP